MAWRVCAEGRRHVCERGRRDLGVGLCYKRYHERSPTLITTALFLDIIAKFTLRRENQGRGIEERMNWCDKGNPVTHN